MCHTHSACASHISAYNAKILYIITLSAMGARATEKEPMIGSLLLLMRFEHLPNAVPLIASSFTIELAGSSYLVTISLVLWASLCISGDLFICLWATFRSNALRSEQFHPIIVRCVLHCCTARYAHHRHTVLDG